MVYAHFHPAFNENSKKHCAQLQCISSTLYSLSQSIAWLQSGELRIAEILQTDGLSAQESVNKSFVRIRLYYLYLPMDVWTIFLHIFNKADA
jgi:hypothetical protein